MGSAEEFLNVDDMFRQELRDELLQAVLDFEKNRPRSLQTEIGPSQAGAVCARRLAWAVTARPGTNGRGDPLPSMVGTSMHRTMEEVMEAHNKALGYERWLTETAVKEPIPGTCDLYDTKTFTVIDWKFPGTTAFKKYSTQGPSPEYREQIHLYGLGNVNLGRRVDNVGIMFIPRAGRLSGSHLFLEPYDEDRAKATAKRLEDIKTVVTGLDIRKHPERANHVPATPSDHCGFCPYWSPNPQGPLECIGMAGDPNEHLRREDS